MRVSAAIAWGIAALVVALLAATATFDILAGADAPSWLETISGLVALATLGYIGTLLALRKPRNAIGWLLLATAVVGALSGLAEGYASYAILAGHDVPADRLAVHFDNALWPLLIAGLAAVILMFPDGRLTSRASRIIAGCLGVSCAGLVLTSLVAPDHFDPPFEHVAPAFPTIDRGSVEPLALLFLLVLFGSLLATLWGVVRRFRRAEGIERLQLSWLAYAAAFVPGIIVACFADILVFGDVGTLTSAWLFVTLIAIPAAVGVAVLRYRLYEIDRLVNRTLVYAALTLLLAAVYAAAVLVLGVAVGRGSALATAGATLAVAVLFRPARDVVQRGVDRRFNPRRHEGLRRVEQFLGELREGRMTPESTGRVLSEALGDPSAELRYWLPESEIYADAEGRPAPDHPDDPRAGTPIERRGTPLGMLLHDPKLLERRDLLDSVVSAAGLAIEITRLRVEVNRQLTLVEESRARIVVAGHEERRRLERDLHDGAQQRLVSIGLALRHVQHELPDDSGPIADQLDATVAEVARAIEELRDIARGLRPALLEDGLGPALHALAARAPLEVDVDVHAPGDLDEGVEIAAFYVAAEALTNAAKHAGATRVRLAARVARGRLVVSVSDNGRGGAEARAGSGLEGLRDRLDTHGGRMTVESASGEGTTITAELPCA